MQDTNKKARREWLADKQDDFIRGKFWDKACIVLVVAWVIAIVAYILITK